MIKINCKKCLGDNCDNCLSDNCLCRENHRIKESLKNKSKLRGKEHWGHTDIEKEFTNYMIFHFDEIFKEYLR